VTDPAANAAPDTYRLLSSRFDIAQKPCWDLSDLSTMLDLPHSTLIKVIDEHPAPLFLLGRKKYIWQKDAIEWLMGVAEACPHTKRRNNRAK
jgi:hypothetical protein